MKAERRRKSKSQYKTVPVEILFEEYFGRKSVVSLKEIKLCKTYDVFISHATEDKQFVRRLAEKLRRRGLRVWFDETNIKLGDSVRQKIDEGLTASRFVVFVLSRNFFRKKWTVDELDGALAGEQRGRKRILPILHGMTYEHLVKLSPIIAGRLAVVSGKGLEYIASQIREVVCGARGGEKLG